MFQFLLSFWTAIFIYAFPLFCAQGSNVLLGVDVFFKENKIAALKGKRVGLITNHTGADGQLRSTVDLFLNNFHGIQIAALFSPEHGFYGQAHAEGAVADQKEYKGIPVYSLFGKLRRPTRQMLKGIDVLIYDIQDIGCRTYTYITTLFYAMEEASKEHIPLIVLDRPNPINGHLVEGPMLKEKWRSFIGYVNVPYCHGMTIGELARFFNEEYHIGCALEVVPMQGWQRWMSYADTHLTWIPTSPNISEADTPLYYASTGIIGELGIVNIGIGYTLPFKILGAPWIKAEEFAEKMNAQHLPGVVFLPFHFRPFYGIYKEKECQGVLIRIIDAHSYKPLAVQYMLLGILNLLYPKHMQTRLAALNPEKRVLFCKANGNDEMLDILCKEKYVAWKLITYQKEERDSFRQARKKYFLYPQN
ncbi:MAG TPA: DUF1343 domain-containing protein [Rhabdochlamydiaceae bacterium]|jgi:uncharacterized protein YbbC (DUF1343 family)